MSIYSRTDLALEAHELWSRDTADTSALQGVKASSKSLDNLELTELHILTSQGSAALNKPIGSYYSIELKNDILHAGDIFKAACYHCSELISSLTDKYSSFLIAALGNPDITPDALGPLAASGILVSHHLKTQAPESFSFFGDTMLIRPGVLGSSGLESAAQIKAYCERFKPQCLIVIDALAGLSLNRLCRCIQISDAGISPGSGVGNNRQEISFNTMGIPVISIGAPTVTDASALCEGEDCRDMFVTPRNIDSSVRFAARLISYSINLAIHKNLSIEDIEALLA